MKFLHSVVKTQLPADILRAFKMSHILYRVKSAILFEVQKRLNWLSFNISLLPVWFNSSTLLRHERQRVAFFLRVVNGWQIQCIACIVLPSSGTKSLLFKQESMCWSFFVWDFNFLVAFISVLKMSFSTYTFDNSWFSIIICMCV